MIKRVCVFCGSSSKVNKQFLDNAFYLGERLAELGVEIIYGGGKVGMMGRLSDGSLTKGGKVIGIIPEFMQSLEWGRQDIHELQEVETMHQREAILIQQCDLIVTLPGGIGTMEEFLQAISWKFLGLIVKPIYLVNINNYFNPLIKMFEKTILEGFMGTEQNNLFRVVDTIDELIFEIIRIDKQENSISN